MTSSLPNSSDDIFTKGYIYRYHKDKKQKQVILNTLWDMINQSAKCSYFKNIIIKSLLIDELNSPYAPLMTIFVPINIESQIQLTERHVFDSFSFNATLPIFSCIEPTNIKLMNRRKERVSLNVMPGGESFVAILGIVWKVIVPNVKCINGLIHIIEPFIQL